MGGPDCHEEQLGTPCNPINARQDHKMHPHDLTASVKASVKADLAIYHLVFDIFG